MNNLLIFIIVAALLWGVLGSDLDAQEAPPPASVPADSHCADDLRAQYADQWADLSIVERMAIGLRASACEGR